MSIAEAAITQIESLLAEIEPKIFSNNGTPWFRGDDPQATEAMTRMLAAAQRLAPGGSTHRLAAEAVAARRGYTNAHVPAMVGVLRALRHDYADGYMQSVEALVHADLFNDLMEMAEHLVDTNKDGAAILGGSVLEEHLRKMAGLHGVALRNENGGPRTAGPINEELAKAGAYNALTQKRVTALLHVRNKAAHGEYDEYDRAAVADLLRETRDLMERHPA